jgi:hypothetical protein
MGLRPGGLPADEQNHDDDDDDQGAQTDVHAFSLCVAGRVVRACQLIAAMVSYPSTAFGKSRHLKGARDRSA